MLISIALAPQIMQVITSSVAPGPYKSPAETLAFLDSSEEARAKK